MHDPSPFTLAMQMRGLRELVAAGGRLRPRLRRVAVAEPGLRLPVGHVPAHLDERRPATA